MLPSRGSAQCGRCINGLITYGGEKFTPQSRNSFEVKATISTYEMLMPGQRERIVPSAPSIISRPQEKAKASGCWGEELSLE